MYIGQSTSKKGAKEMKEEFRKMLSELVGEELEFDGFKEEFEKEGLPHDLVLRAIQAAQLKRIADVLEDINSTLIDMSTPIESLAECVDVAPARYGGREYTFLHIGGSVDAGV